MLHRKVDVHIDFVLSALTFMRFLGDHGYIIEDGYHGSLTRMHISPTSRT